MTLKEARERKGLSIAEAADKIGVHETTVQNWEIGKNLPTAPMFFYACQAYGADPRDIPIPGKNDMRPLTLKGARYNAGMTVLDVAEELQMDKGSVYNYEEGRRTIPAGTVTRLCELYKVLPEEIELPNINYYHKEEESVNKDNKTQTTYNTGEYDQIPGAPEKTELDKLLEDIEDYKNHIEKLTGQVKELEKEVMKREKIREALEDKIRALEAKVIPESSEITILRLKAELYDAYKKGGLI